MKTASFILSTLLITLITFSCKHDTVDPVYDCAVDSVTWENNVKFTIQSKCQGCHTAGSFSPTLDTYAQVMVIVNDGRLMNVINHNPGYMAMPYNSEKLEPCVIENIQSWVDAGAPEDY